MSSAPPAGSTRFQRHGLIHRYWRAAALSVVVLLGIAYLPYPHHRSNAGEAFPAGAVQNRAGAPATSSAGHTVAGVKCQAGVRQLPLSAYADYCVPSWEGSNGGATAHGVTRTAITLTYREAASSVLQLLYGWVPAPVVGTNDQAVATMQAYIRVFNKYFELYGRHVVLKPFTGQSDFLLEDSGLDAPQAQADAATAYDAGAFADMSLVDSSEVYVADLAAEKVVAMSLYLEPESWYRQLAPFEFTTGPDCDKEASAAASVLAATVAGIPATDVGGSLYGKPGKIGVIYPDTGEFPECASEISGDLASRYDVKTVAEAGYSVDITTLSSQAQSLMAQMASAGVTTIVCSSCDPITPQYLSRAAVGEGYFPQWYVDPAFALAGSDDDGFVQLLPASTVAHAVQLGTMSQPVTSQEAYRVLEMSGITATDPGKVSPTYPFIYAQLLMFYDALQNAGSYLTPSTFEEGAFSIPESTPGGEFGLWKGGRGVFDPQQGYTFLHWDSHLVSPQNGRPGSFVACDMGRTFAYDTHVLAGVVRGTPLSCPAVP